MFIIDDIYTLRHSHSLLFTYYHDLLRILAAVRVRRLLHTSLNACAVLVASRIGNPRASPDAPSPVNAVRAGDQIAATELEVVVLVDRPAGAFGVLRSRLGTRGVADFALACACSC